MVLADTGKGVGRKLCVSVSAWKVLWAELNNGKFPRHASSITSWEYHYRRALLPQQHKLYVDRIRISSSFYRVDGPLS